MSSTLTHEDLKAEMTRRKSRRLSMLQLFQKEGELTTKDLLQFGPGLSSRLKELRNDGHKIVSVYEKPGHWRYVYLGHEDGQGASVRSVE